jgi:hypothetical protein
MTSRERILQYVEYKRISKNKFYKETGLSNGFLDKNNHPGTDKLEQIIYTYPEINPEWLLTGQGSMLKTDTYNNVSPPGAIESRQQPTTAKNSQEQPPAAPHECIYKELLKEKKAEYKAELKEQKEEIKALNREIWERDKEIEALQELLQAAKKSANRYAIEDRESFPSSMAAEPEVRYQKQE